ncbi:SLATT domain-containing protein [Polaribacter sp. Asnod6-C07]|uniref:SLATT domain-containing protein n=1 Tax=Polaribacter sp. Asnod6-C07 TaxID=3160582 RepID=UPI0038661F85
MYSTKEKRRVSAGHNLAFKMWSTKGARFVADERCKKSYRLSSFTIAFLSFEVIAISIYSLTGSFDSLIESKIITSWTLILSILFLVLSIFENTKNYNVKAKDYHNCGLEIGKVYSKLKMILATNKDGDFNDLKILNPLQDEYDKILDKYENHEEVDYAQYKINKKKDFKINYGYVLKNQAIIYFNTKFLYHFLIIIVPIILITSIVLIKETNTKKNDLDIENNIEITE